MKKVIFWTSLFCLFLYWATSYKPSGDFFRLDETTNVSKDSSDRFKALKMGFSGNDTRSRSRGKTER